MGGRHWTPAEEALVIAKRRYWTVETLARHVDRTPKAVISWSQKHNVWPWNGSWWTPIEIANLTGYSRQWITRLCQDGSIRARKVPGMTRWIIPPDQAESFIQENNPAIWHEWNERQRHLIR